jgi:hypothetical protein
MSSFEETKIEKSRFDSGKSYLSYCEKKGYSGDEDANGYVRSRFNTRDFVVGKPDRSMTRHNLSDFLKIACVDDRREMFLRYFMMCKSGDWLYPEWDGPCGSVMLRSAYSIHLENINSGKENFEGSLFDFVGDDYLCRLGKGNDYRHYDQVATALEISFLVYNESQNLVYRVGEGTFLNNFLAYVAPGHVIAVNSHTLPLGTILRTTETGLIVIGIE